MPLTETQLKAKIANDLGSADDAQFADIVEQNWLYCDDQAYKGLKIHALYTLQETINSLMRGEWRRFKWTEGVVTEDKTKILDNLNALLTNVQAQIKTQEAKRYGGQVQSGVIAAKTPISPPPCGPDPSSRALRGDPVERYPLRRPYPPYDN